MTMRLPKVFFAVIVSTSLSAAAPAGAGDHLACYKVKDTLPKQKFENVQLLSNTGDTAPLSGCAIATGAKFCCDAVDKLGVPAQPSGATDPGPALGKFCCYKVKCPNVAGGALRVTDQFGSRTLSITKPPKIICAPDVPTTTTTIATTTTTTTSSTTTTTTLPCIGEVVGPACWYLGSDGDNCDTTCLNWGRVYDPATASYAGSGGTDAKCTAVLTALGVGMGNASAADCGTEGLGCVNFADFRLRCQTPPTDSTSLNPSFKRACACM